MKKHIISLIVLGFAFGQSAQALVEARLHYGAVAVSPDFSKLYSGTETLPAKVPIYGLGGDLLFNIPMMNWGGGIRVENLGLKASTSALEFNTELSRTSAVLYSRFINTLLYLGVIGTYGLSHSNSIKVKVNGTETSNISGNPESYSIGLEGGVGILGFRVGGEVGQQYINIKDAKDTGTAALATQNIDLSGSYMKVIVGFGF